jgi:GNAT superfamily N-acetyltransferase
MREVFRQEILVRPIRPDDAAAVARIHSAACRIAYRFMNWNYALDAVEDWVRTERMPAWDWGLAGEAAGVPVAYIAMTERHVDHLFVMPDAQGGGIGSMLFQRASADAQCVRSQRTRAAVLRAVRVH